MNILENYNNIIKEDYRKQDIISVLLESYKLNEATEIADDIIDAIKTVTGEEPEEIDLYGDEKIELGDEIDKFKVGGKYIRMGKILKRLVPGLTDKQMEKILIILKGLINAEKNTDYLVFEEWNDVSNAYDLNHFGSCMHGESDCLSFYDYESNITSLLLFDERKDEEHNDVSNIGRALVWRNVKDVKTGETVTYMDRVYPPDNTVIIGHFHNYAKKNGWLYRKNQDIWLLDADDIISNGHDLLYVTYTVFDDYDGQIKMPFVDTFRYLDSSNGEMSNSPRVVGYTYKLEDDDGTYVGYDTEIDGEYFFSQTIDNSTERGDIITYTDCHFKNCEGNYLDLKGKKTDWIGGTLHDVDWDFGGTFRDGVLNDSRWTDGIWINGTANGCDFEDSVWENGEYNGKDFGMDCTFENSLFKDGNFVSGVFKNSQWKSGTWLGGNWESGEIYSEKYNRWLESNVNPAKFYRFEEKSNDVNELIKNIESY